ncbi:MgtC/SapB family protein, partial [Acinetobacter sp. ANC 4216]
TATTIWMTAALGMAAGAGYEMLSLFATFIVLIVLIFLIYVQEKIEALSQARTYRIICPYQRKILDQYEALFKTYNMKVVRSVQHKTEHRMSGRWILIGSAENHKKLTAYLLNDSNIQELGF